MELSYDAKSEMAAKPPLLTAVLASEFEPTTLEKIQMFVEFRARKLRHAAIRLLGGYDQVAVGKLLYTSRRVCQELEGYEGALLGVLHNRMKKNIFDVDPELGRMYGYDPHVSGE